MKKARLFNLFDPESISDILRRLMRKRMVLEVYSKDSVKVYPTYKGKAAVLRKAILSVN